MTSGKPTREQADLAEVLEMVLDKGIVINADIAVTVGEVELLGIELRAAIASFETAAKYGLAFPSGTDMRRVEQASGRQSLEGEDGDPLDLGIDASSGGAAKEAEAVESESEDDADQSSEAAPGRRPTPTVTSGGAGGDDGGEEAEAPADVGAEAGEDAAGGGESSADDSDADDGGES